MHYGFGGRDYEILLGGDVAKEGFFAELWDITDGALQILLLAFHSDADGKKTISAYREDLPLELVEQFLEVAKRRLPPSLSPEHSTQP